MDPISIIGLASSIITFIDFGIELVSYGREIQSSVRGLATQNATLERVIEETQAWCSNLRVSYKSSLPTPEERAIVSLAGECKVISDEILIQLKKIKPKNPKSKPSIAIAIIKDKWHSEDRTKLQNRLEKCQSRLRVQLETLDRSKIKDRLAVLTESAAESNTKLESLQKAIEDLKAVINSSCISRDVADQFQELNNVSEQSVRRILQQRMITALAFPEMHSRVDKVAEAHSKTFHWILEDTPSSTIQHSSDITFIDWLTSGTGVFHISGKLGSGKSTLMKYLCEDPRTNDLLGKWAKGKGKKLININFFFWRAGTDLQKSIAGLIRSFIHEILEHCPDLADSLFPTQWQKLMPLHSRELTDLKISARDIRFALKTLLDNTEFCRDYCLCFFIDGLDEYEEIPGEDYEDMATMLLDWTEIAPDNFKLCVSSRELNIFQNTFSPKQRLRLQELTKNDIEAVIRDRLSRLKLADETVDGENLKEELISEIIKKADGVFFWVTLVLMSLRKGYLARDRFQDLIQKVNQMPEGMEPLFLHLINSITRSERRAAYRTFAVVMQLAESKCADMSLLRYTFLEDYDKDPDFAFNSTQSQSSARQSEILFRLERALDRLNGQCCGLLEVKEGVNSFIWQCEARDWLEEERQVVTFTHRSAYDFLKRLDIQQQVIEELQKFDIIQAICHSSLAELKLEPKLWFSLFPEAHNILRLWKIGTAPEFPPFRFLESLDKLCVGIQKLKPGDESLLRYFVLVRAITYRSAIT